MRTLILIITLAIFFTGCEKDQNSIDFTGFDIQTYTSCIGADKQYITYNVPGNFDQNPIYVEKNVIVKDMYLNNVQYSFEYQFNTSNKVNKILIRINTPDLGDFYYHYSYELAKLFGAGQYNFQTFNGIYKTYSNLEDYWDATRQYSDIATYNMYWTTQGKTIRHENIGFVVIYIY